MLKSMAFWDLKALFVLSIVIICGTLTSGCRQAVEHNPSAHPEALMLHPRAENTKFLELEGTDQLTYTVRQKFPASGVIGWISHALEEKGWEPLTYDYLNPDLPSSHVKGWEKFGDATQSPEHVVHQWLAEWQDSSGNIVRYAFRYNYPQGGTPNLTDLEVSAVYIPAPLAKQMLEEVRKFKEKQRGG